jgi:hypothetical protein
MKRFKKALKLCFLVLILFLACIGVGIAGGVPIPFSRRKENDSQTKIELVESKDDATSFTQIDVKK